ncbi:putative myb transcription factor [Tieghemostelium lacteum]|uniref:Putative myb transcription factor n=1 Tax=Tieghemostelium lacteum TaxID=361077 RepID=A0A151ZD86_TIELA|nr:putative myb transcription factor [Tieghemostelium lacteum]|eukprot:KYQ91918.1 putative myb transcription factor [Tieghemostelium lacteum]
MMRVIFIILLSLSCISLVLSTCEINNGHMSASGSCSGPIERSLLQFNSLDQTNNGCPTNKIRYGIDGVSSNPSECSECVPGTNGVSHPGTCKLNEYCSDSGTCTDLKNHPLYNVHCPDEKSTLGLNWCGSGLTCIAHLCSICQEGVIDYKTDGKMCVNGEWTRNRMDTKFTTPVSVFTFVIMLLLIFILLCQIKFQKIFRFIRDSIQKRNYKKSLKLKSLSKYQNTNGNSSPINNSNNNNNVNNIKND